MSITTSPTILVHWLENSRSQRILWLLEEMNLAYEVKMYQRHPVTKLAQADLKEIHPLGKSPVITIEENGETITLAESGAIVEYILERFGPSTFGAKGMFIPASGGSSAKDRANYLYWLHWAEGTAMLPLMLTIVFSRIPKQSPWFIRPITQGLSNTVMDAYILPKLRANFAFVETELKDREFFVGNQLTGADVMMIFPIEGLESAGELNKYPSIKSWLERMRSRDGYKAAEENGGKVDLSYFVK